MRMQDLTFSDFGLIMLCITIYFLPFFIAIVRDHKNRIAICLLNLFLGWTGLGWLGALIWAVTK